MSMLAQMDKKKLRQEDRDRILMLLDLALGLTDKEREDLATFMAPEAMKLFEKLPLLGVDQQLLNSRRGKAQAKVQLSSISGDKMKDMAS